MYNWILCLLAFVYFILGSCLFLVLFLLSPFNPVLRQKMCRILGGGSLKIIGVKVLFENKEKLDQDQPCFYVSNHQHNLDAFITASHFPKQTIIIGKKSIFYVPIFGQVYWLSGNLFINRSNIKKAYATLSDGIKSMHEKKNSIWAFPEGTRNPSRNLRRFKRGIFYAAFETGYPIVPVVISPYTPDGEASLNQLRKKPIIIRALDSINPKDYPDVPSLAVKAQEAMQAEIDNNF